MIPCPSGFPPFRSAKFLAGIGLRFHLRPDDPAPDSGPRCCATTPAPV
jgi:hypothetical protein